MLRRSALKRGERLKPVSDKRREENGAHRDVRMALAARDRGRCLLEGREAWGTDGKERVGPCAGPWTPHHVEKAWKGGAYDLDNLLTLCARHNTWVEDEPDLAWMMGLVQRAGDTPEGCARRRVVQWGLGR